MCKWKVSCIVGTLTMILGITAQAELYVAGQVGANIPQDMTDVRGVEASSGVTVSDLDLDNQVVFGVKFGGYLPNSLNWLGFEGEYYHTDSDIKQQPATLSGPIPALSVNPGIVEETDIAVNTIALNALVRYPGERIQPYAGIGVGLNIFSIDAITGVSGNPFAPTLNLLAGVRGFVTDRIAAFFEYKHNRGSVEFPDVGFEADYRVNMFLGGVSYHWR